MVNRSQHVRKSWYGGFRPRSASRTVLRQYVVSVSRRSQSRCLVLPEFYSVHLCVRMRTDQRLYWTGSCALGQSLYSVGSCCLSRRYSQRIVMSC